MRRLPTDIATGLAEVQRQEQDEAYQKPLLSPAEAALLSLAWWRWLAIRGLMETVTIARRRR